MLDSDKSANETMFLEEEVNLHNQIDNLNKEIRRKSYIATGLMAIILDTKDDNLIQEATNIMNAAETVN